MRLLKAPIERNSNADVSMIRIQNHHTLPSIRLYDYALRLHRGPLGVYPQVNKSLSGGADIAH